MAEMDTRKKSEKEVAGGKEKKEWMKDQDKSRDDIPETKEEKEPDRKPKKLPPQTQKTHPGSEHKMDPEPSCLAPNYKGSGKLANKIAVITGADSGIGRSVAILYAREGAKVAIMYYHEDKDAEATKDYVEKEGSEALLIKGDIADPAFCEDAIKRVVSKWGRVDILVNNAAQQYKRLNIEDIPNDQLERVFRVNIFSMFYLTKACLPHMAAGSSIVNSTSVTAYRGHEVLIDYSTTKGAILTFTYSLSQQLAPRKIRVNAVAPGPIWTPLIPSCFGEEEVKKFGKDTPLGRPGQPEECAPSYVFLASEADSSYITGQVLHPNGGHVVHG
jgi:NAD(P)-dependent dehydrogenase (short-subunit alcohol dehydrogenase family)